MVSMGGPSASTSFQGTDAAPIPITGSELNELVNKTTVCILDCRAHGVTIKGATKVRLPHVLFRRLQNGSLPLANISSRLSDENLPVIVIPEEEETPAAQSKALLKALTKDANRYVRMLTDDIDSMLSKFPDLSDEQPLKTNDDVTCLNLNSLRIDGNSMEMPTPITKTNDKKQIFPVQILPHLYLGNAETANNKELLLSHGIHRIVNVTSNLPNAFEDDDDFHYLRISVDDNASFNLTQFFPAAIDFIDTAATEKDAVLVHCLAGISRSVTICLAYLMASRKWSLEDAYDVVLGRNASIAPNFHFMGQLTDYERHLGIPSTKSSAPRSPSCSAQAAALPSSCLTPPPTSCAANPSGNNMGGFS